MVVNMISYEIFVSLERVVKQIPPRLYKITRNAICCIIRVSLQLFPSKTLDKINITTSNNMH